MPHACSSFFNRYYTFTLLLTALVAATSFAQPLQPTNIWTLPGNHSGGTINWSTGPWDILPPAGGSATTVLQFNSTSANSFTAANNMGSPFRAVGFILNGSSSGATITLDDVGSNQINLSGINPFFYQTGSSPVIIQGLLTLQPSSGTTTFAGNGTGIVTLNNTMVGFGGVTKSGTGTLILNQATGVTGGFVVSGGTLQIANSDGASATGAGSLTIQSGGTVTGNGLVQPIASSGIAIQSGGMLTPGDRESLGALTIESNSGNVTFASGSKWGIRIGAPDNGGADSSPNSGNNTAGDPGANVGYLKFTSDTGTLTLNADTIVVLSGNPSQFAPGRAYSYKVGEVPTGSSGSVTNPANFNTSGFANVTSASLNIVDQNVYLNFVAPVPEPVTNFAIASFGLGVIAFGKSRLQYRMNRVE